MRVSVISCFLLFLVALSTPAGARNPESLGDLTIDAARVPDFYLPDLDDASGWQSFDLTSGSDTGTLGCEVLDPAGSQDNTSALQCAIDAAPARSRLFLPAGTYRFTGGFRIWRGELVLEGAGIGRTVVRFDHDAEVSCYGIPHCGVAALCPPDSIISICSTEDSTGYSRTNWTGGFAPGSQKLQLDSTSGLSVGNWVRLNGDEPVDPGIVGNWDPRSNGERFRYLAKITALDAVAGTITIDHPLRNDWEASANRSVVRIGSIEQVGIENLELQVVDPETQTNGSFARFVRVQNSWVRGVKFGEQWSHQVALGNDSARILVESCLFQGPIYKGIISASAISINTTIDSVIHNNQVLACGRGITFQDGSNGNVAAYNYFDATGSPSGCTRAIFLHGDYPRENLMEGNVIGGDTCRFEQDNYWGIQGPYNTYYRNRAVNPAGPSDRWGLALSTHFDNGALAAQWLNVIGNFTHSIRSVPGACTLFDACSTGHLADTWLEKNRVQSDLMLEPRPDTTSIDNFISDSVPAELQGLEVPDSLYLPAVPEWWCENACSFAGEQGVGAFGDDLAAGLCLIPAEIAATGGICNPSQGPECGNDLVEQGEDCEGPPAVDCADLGLGTGPVTCTGDCKHDTSQCAEPTDGGDEPAQPDAGDPHGDPDGSDKGNQEVSSDCGCSHGGPGFCLPALMLLGWIRRQRNLNQV